MKQPLNNLLRYAQSTGGSPYDEEDYMPPQSSAGVNRFLADRMQNRLSPQMMDYMHGGYPGYAGRNQIEFGRPREQGLIGTDTDMMIMYGPEDQVVFDQNGSPIPLADQRHPRNQRAPAQPFYPQQRR